MAFAAAAGFVAACGSSNDNGTASPSTDKKAEPKTLNFYNWTAYIADNTPSGTASSRE